MKPAILKCEDKATFDMAYDQSYYTRTYEEQRKFKRYLRDIIYKQEWKLIRPGKHYILDLGCGIGDFLKSSNAEMVLGVDISEFAVKSLKRVNKFGIIADMKYLPFKSETVGYVVLNDVIEHLEVDERNQSLKELLNLLHPRGRIIIRTTNLELKLRKHKSNMESIDDGDPTHKFLYSRKCLEDILEEYGFKITFSSSDFMLAALCFIPSFIITDSILKLLAKFLWPLENLYGCLFIMCERQVVRSKS